MRTAVTERWSMFGAVDGELVIGEESIVIDFTAAPRLKIIHREDK